MLICHYCMLHAAGQYTVLTVEKCKKTVKCFLFIKNLSGTITKLNIQVKRFLYPLFSLNIILNHPNFSCSILKLIVFYFRQRPGEHATMNKKQ